MIFSILPNAEFGSNDNRVNASHFKLGENEKKFIFILPGKPKIMFSDSYLAF